MAVPQPVDIGAEMTEFPGVSFNELVAEYWRRRGDRPGGRPKGGGSAGPALTVLVQNASGAAREPGHILGISSVIHGYPLDPDQVYRPPLILGITPTTAHASQFVVVKQHIENNAVGPAVLMGATWAKVSVTDISHDFATVSNNVASYLASSGAGVPVIYKQKQAETGSAALGVQWALVLMGGGGSDLPVQLAVVTQSHGEPTYSGSGLTFEIQDAASFGKAILLRNAIPMDVDDSQGSTLAELEFQFINIHRDSPIGVGDVIRVWRWDGAEVVPGDDIGEGGQRLTFGEFYNATEHLRRLTGYSTNPADPLTLQTDNDELYWDVGGGTGPEGPAGPQGPAGPSGPGPAEGYATDVAGDVVNFAPTEITGWSAASFQIFAHNTTAGETTDEDDPPWKSVAQYDATKKQMWWHQAGVFNFETTTDYGGSATEPQFLLNWGAGNGGEWQWKSATGYDNTDSTQLLGHINGTWQWKTIAEWLNLLAGYASGSDQIIGHAAGGATEWKTLTSKVINNPTDIDLVLDADSLDSTLDYVPVTVKLWPAASDGGAATFTESVTVDDCS